MDISKLTAKSLMEEIHSIIDFDVNIMNEKGVIIESTNPQRIEQFHEGAYKIIMNHLDKLIVYHDNEYAGCKKGINFPILFNQDVVGVIGITGEIADTLRYGSLICKVTEILLKDLLRLQQSAYKEMEKQTFVNNWLNSDIEANSETVKEIEKYNLFRCRPFVVSIIKIKQDEAQIRPVMMERMNQNEILTCYYGNEQYVVIGNMQSVQKCREVIETVLNPYAEMYICAIGTCQSDYTGVPKSYREARQVLQLKAGFGCGIYLFDNEIFNIMINNISTEYKVHLIRKVFERCNEKEIPEFVDFINIYCKNNGSINAIAAELFIHKNTVQYKINKILLRTGFDLRVFDDLKELHFVALWYPFFGHLL